MVEEGRHEGQSEREGCQERNNDGGGITFEVGDLEEVLQEDDVEPLEAERDLVDRHRHVFHEADSVRTGNSPDTIDHLQKSHIDSNTGEGHNQKGNSDRSNFGRIYIEARSAPAAQEELHKPGNGQSGRVNRQATLEIASGSIRRTVGGVGVEGPDHKCHRTDKRKAVNCNGDDTHGADKAYISSCGIVFDGNKSVFFGSSLRCLSNGNHIGDVTDPSSLDDDHQKEVEVFVAPVMDSCHVTGEESSHSKDKDTESGNQSPESRCTWISCSCSSRSKASGDASEREDHAAKGHEHQQSSELAGVGLESVGGTVGHGVFVHGDCFVFVDLDFVLDRFRFEMISICEKSSVNPKKGFF